MRNTFHSKHLKHTGSAERKCVCVCVCVCVCENLRTFLSVCLFKGVESFGVIYGMFVSEFRCRKIMRCVCDCMINALVCVSLCVCVLVYV